MKRTKTAVSILALAAIAVFSGGTALAINLWNPAPIPPDTSSPSATPNGTASVSENHEGKEGPEKADYQISISSDYVATKAEDLANLADAVVFGAYLGDTATYANEVGRPVTEGEFSVERVLKGAVQPSQITIGYYGGTITLQEYILSQGEESIQKLGLVAPSVSEGPTKTVGNPITKESVIAESGQNYLCYLSYDEESDGYFVLCDAYGMRPENEAGNFFDPATEHYESLTLFKEATE